jgi:hypothetical protein
MKNAVLWDVTPCGSCRADVLKVMSTVVVLLLICVFSLCRKYVTLRCDTGI